MWGRAEKASGVSEREEDIKFHIYLKKEEEAKKF